MKHALKEWRSSSRSQASRRALRRGTKSAGRSRNSCSRTSGSSIPTARYLITRIGYWSSTGCSRARLDEIQNPSLRQRLQSRAGNRRSQAAQMVLEPVTRKGMRAIVIVARTNGFSW